MCMDYCLLFLNLTDAHLTWHWIMQWCLQLHTYYLIVLMHVWWLDRNFNLFSGHTFKIYNDYCILVFVFYCCTHDSGTRQGESTRTTIIKCFKRICFSIRQIFCKRMSRNASYHLEFVVRLHVKLPVRVSGAKGRQETPSIVLMFWFNCT